jgi:hypothetical protein
MAYLAELNKRIYIMLKSVWHLPRRISVLYIAGYRLKWHCAPFVGT